MPVPSRLPDAPSGGRDDASSGALSRCVGVGREVFAHEHWSRRLLLTRAAGLPRDFADLLAEDDVDTLVAERGLREPFFRTVRQGATLARPVRGATAGNRRIVDLVDADALVSQYDGGATLVLQSLHRLHPPVLRFCRQLAAELGHPTQCNAYVTPGGQAQGFDFHHDTHDVFVLQVAGRKRWLVYEPVLPLPLNSQPRSGADLVPPGAVPVLDVVLEAGDSLYLPRGYVHAAITTEVHSVHLTVGVLSTTWYDVLSDALTLAAEEERFRDALPVTPSDDLAASLPAFLHQAAGWLAALPAAEVETVVRRRLLRAEPLAPLRLLAQARAVRDLDRTTALAPRAGLACSVSREGDRIRLGLPGRALLLPAVAEAGLRAAVSGPAVVADLAVGGLDVDDALVLARRLLRERVLVPDLPSP